MSDNPAGYPMNPHPERVTIYIRFPKVRDDKFFMFIQLYGPATHTQLEQIKAVWLQLRAAQEPQLGFDNHEGARMLAQKLLDFKVVERVDLFDPLQQCTEALKATPPPPYYLCPQCQEKLGGSNECRQCAWMRYPGNRERWGQQGRCPHCEFAYRWDGICCSHCGHGATAELPRIKIVPES